MLKGQFGPPVLQDEGSIFLLNAIINLRNYTVSKPRSIQPQDLQECKDLFQHILQTPSLSIRMYASMFVYGSTGTQSNPVFQN